MTSWTNAMRIYAVTTFVSALIVLVISIAIVIVSALMYPKVKSMYNTTLSIENKINQFTNMSWSDIIITIVKLLLNLVGLDGNSREGTKLQRALIDTLRPGFEQEDAERLLSRINGLQRQGVSERSIPLTRSADGLMEWLRSNNIVQ